MATYDELTEWAGLQMPPQAGGQEAKGRAGHVDTGLVDKHAKPLVDTVLLVEIRLPGASPRCQANWKSAEAGWKRLTVMGRGTSQRIASH